MAIAVFVGTVCCVDCWLKLKRSKFDSNVAGLATEADFVGICGVFVSVDAGATAELAAVVELVI